MADLSKKLRFAVLHRDAFTCQYCGTSDGPLHVDHVTPVSAGGESHAGNLITACQACNAGKSAMLIEQSPVVSEIGNGEPREAAVATVEACVSITDAINASIALSGLTYRELAARMGKGKSLIGKLVKGEAVLTERNTRAFCGATGTLLVVQYREMRRALDAATGRIREADRIATMIAPTRQAWMQQGAERRAA